jgi:hypothetical protein
VISMFIPAGIPILLCRPLVGSTVSNEIIVDHS